MKDEWIKQYNKPKEIISDSGRQFLADNFIEFCNKNEIKRTNTSAYNPTGNSIVARVHQTLGNNLRIYKNILPIDEILLLTQNNINLCHHNGIKGIPTELANIMNPINLGDRKILMNLEENFKIQRRIKEKELERRNSKRRIYDKFKIGDAVMVKKTCERTNSMKYGTVLFQ